MRTFKNCELYNINMENWSNFAPLHYNEISDFEQWATEQAFSKMGLKTQNSWYWQDGSMWRDINTKGRHTKSYQLYITANGILILREYDVTQEDFTQVAQYRVKMNLV